MYVFPKKVTLLIIAKLKVQYDLQHRCVTQQLSLLLFCFVAFHYMTTLNLMRHSFSLKVLVQSMKKKKKKERQRKRNDYSVIEQNALSCNYMEYILKGSLPKMTGKMRVWPVKSTIRPDIVRWPAVILSPEGTETESEWFLYNFLSFLPLKTSFKSVFNISFYIISFLPINVFGKRR